MFKDDWQMTIKREMFEKKVGVKALADSLGYSRSYISRILNNGIMPIKTILIIIEKLGLKKTDIFDN